MNLPPIRGRSNTILVVDDKRGIHGFYWQIFNPNEQEFDPPFLPPQQDVARARALQIEYSRCFDEFERVFSTKLSQGRRYPLCIIDSRLEREDGTTDDRRGLKTALLVRQLDQDINIIVATHLHDLHAEELRAQLGDNSYLFRLYELETREKLNEFVGTVHALVDRWNTKRSLLAAARKDAPEKISLSELVREACRSARSKQIHLEEYINPGLEVFSHRGALSDGVRCVLRTAVERTIPGGLVRVYCEGSPTGAVLSVSYHGAENEHLALEQLVREGAGADGSGLYHFGVFLSSCGGPLKIAPGLAGRGTTITADIHNM
jgi:hypothetical protein